MQGPSGSYSPEAGPLKKGMLTLPSQKTVKGAASGRRREGFQAVDIEEEQVVCGPLPIIMPNIFDLQQPFRLFRHFLQHQY